MILWSQQLQEITNVYNSFHGGKRVHSFISPKMLKDDKILLNSSKFENMTLSNFKIMLYYHMYTYRTALKTDFLKELNKYTKEDIGKSGKLRQDVLSYSFIQEKDIKVLKTLNVQPYDAFKKSLIHPFTLAKYYEKHSELIQGRIMTQDIKYATILTQYFNF